MSDEVNKTEETTETVEPTVEATEATAEPQAEAVGTVEETPVVEELPHRDVKPGMIIRVHERIKDVNAKGEEKIRTQVFEGMVLGGKGAGRGRTMTVRKDSYGVMVEKIYPLASPNIEKVEIVKQHKVRRAKLTYLRNIFKRKMKEVKK